MQSYRLGVVLVMAATLAWSTAGLFTRQIEVETGAILVWRGIFGAVGIFAVSIALQGRQAWSEYRWLGFGGWGFAVISALGMLCFITGLRLTTVAHVAIIYATVPLVAAAMGWMFLRERMSRSALMAILIAVAGVSVMMG